MRLPEAVDLLRRAAAGRPESSRFADVYAVALHDAGRARDAIATLETAHRRRPADRETLRALVSYLAGQGDVQRARPYAQKLVALDPDDVAGRRLVETLRRAPGDR
jgi:Flp pilus assembly protein TadD